MQEEGNKNEIRDQNVTEVKNWHAFLYNLTKPTFPGYKSEGGVSKSTTVRRRGKRSLISHESAPVGIYRQKVTVSLLQLSIARNIHH